MNFGRYFKAVTISTACAVALLAFAGCEDKSENSVGQRVNSTAQLRTKFRYTKEIKTPEQAIKRLKIGNAHFVAGEDNIDFSPEERAKLIMGQHPYVVIVSCSDSRVPNDEIFNAGPGEVFSVRTAGETLSQVDIGSVEYGVEHTGAILVLVMGHSDCGAVKAAVDGGAEGNIKAITDQIEPAVAEAKKTETYKQAIVSKAVDLNVHNQIKTLKKSKILAHLEKEGKVKIVGARYELHTGKVIFFD